MFAFVSIKKFTKSCSLILFTFLVYSPEEIKATEDEVERMLKPKTPEVFKAPESPVKATNTPTKSGSSPSGALGTPSKSGLNSPLRALDSPAKSSPMKSRKSQLKSKVRICL